MPPSTVILTILGYFAIVMTVSRYAARKGRDFFALRSHRWWVVTLGMVSACMSGVSFVSVPGMVGSSGFGYLQMCIGFFLGYLVIAFVLAPLYFRLGAVSIYGYLDRRFGLTARRSGAWLFFLSQLLRASMRLYLLCLAWQLMIFDPLGLPFGLNAATTVAVVLAYTWRGGVRSVVAADILRTVCMVSAIVLSVVFIARVLPGGLAGTVRGSGMTRVFFFDDANNPQYFWKQLLGGLFIVIAMTGMDQEMMQRTLTCRSLRDAQRQLVLSSALQIVVIAGFLLLGVLLYAYSASPAYAASGTPFHGLTVESSTPPAGDALFPSVAVGGGLPLIVGILFILGLSAASYGAGGSALTALTTAFTVDIMGKGSVISSGNPSVISSEVEKSFRRRTQVLIAIAMTLIILAFRALNDRSVLDAIYTVAGYTYGPLLGLFAFGIFTRRQLPGSRPDSFASLGMTGRSQPAWLLPAALLTAPVLCWLISHYSADLFNGYRFGYELLPLNGALTFLLLLLVSRRKA